MNNSNDLAPRTNSPSIWDSETRSRSEILPLVDSIRTQPPSRSDPEIDDSEDRQVVDKTYSGVDDGFFNNIPDIEHVPTITTRMGEDDLPDGKDSKINNNGSTHPGFMPHDRHDHRTELDFSGIPDLESIPDVNVYQHKKTLAQGMMDLALFSANANQLRYVLESSNRHPYFYPSLTMIGLSLFLQVAIGVGLIWNSRYNVKDEKEICIANKINNYTVIGIFIVTSINVFISAFGVASTPVVTTSTP